MRHILQPTVHQPVGVIGIFLPRTVCRTVKMQSHSRMSSDWKPDGQLSANNRRWVGTSR